ncbi:MAG TPA: glycine cleavage system protein H [Terriglobales bacterium]|nr:glycine cleavage system protein H [Terriglobales bacterium]
MELPPGYFFHPCHTWAVEESWQLIRVGIDQFAANLFGNIARIDITSPNHWVRQGQKLMTITIDGTSVELPSPVEGKVTSLNQEALDKPDVVTDDPLCKGWMAVITSTSFDSDRKNLLQGATAASWMRNSVVLLREICSQSPVLAQDGGRPITGVLKQVSPELRKRLAKELLQSLLVEEIQTTTQHL